MTSTTDSTATVAWKISNISDHSQITTLSSKDPKTGEKSFRVRLPVEDTAQPSGVRWEEFPLEKNESIDITLLTNAPDNVCFCVSCESAEREAAAHKVSTFRLARLLTGLDCRLTAGDVEVPTEDDESVFLVHRAEQMGHQNDPADS